MGTDHKRQKKNRIHIIQQNIVFQYLQVIPVEAERCSVVRITEGMRAYAVVQPRYEYLRQESVETDQCQDGQEQAGIRIDEHQDDRRKDHYGIQNAQYFVGERKGRLDKGIELQLHPPFIQKGRSGILIGKAHIQQRCPENEKQQNDGRCEYGVHADRDRGCGAGDLCQKCVEQRQDAYRQEDACRDCQDQQDERLYKQVERQLDIRSAAHDAHGKFPCFTAGEKIIREENVDRTECDDKDREICRKVCFGIDENNTDRIAHGNIEEQENEYRAENECQPEEECLGEFLPQRTKGICDDHDFSSPFDSAELISVIAEKNVSWVIGPRSSSVSMRPSRI